MAARDHESRIVLLAVSGDVTAFADLVRVHQAYVEALLRRSCGNAALAEDLTQLTFIKAWRQLKTLREPAAFRAWLRRIALNVVTDAARRGAVETSETLGEEHEALSIPCASLETTIIQRLDVESALARLGFAQRTCLVLAYGEGMSHSEIATALGLPPGTVKSHINRGIGILRALLNQKDDPDD